MRNNSLLVGIITEGDIRRALSHKERFFSLKASDIMTKIILRLIKKNGDSSLINNGR